MTVTIRPITEAEKRHLIETDDGLGTSPLKDVRFLELEPDDWSLLPRRLPPWMWPSPVSDGCFIHAMSRHPERGMISLGLDWIERY